jgi:hypothetical protein
MQSLLVLLLFTVAAAAQAEMPAFSGTWRLDRDLTTADLRWNKITILTVSQSDEEVRFRYFDRDRLLGSETFVTDGEERPRYSTRLARAYARARWDENELVVTTRVFLDVYGYQSYNEADRWELSEDGQTLTDKSSDGKMMVYYKLNVEPNRSAP